ncbi:hypothetical protein NQ315_014519 [Exocentrus adspersus]|uniref:mRNA-decapping enzyme C-terminal domain-containing protein n=1 Tax=Exocentrus adspersus TaxID=1586481 RepID=A0AAV8V5E6_9CUCU|nr:hypothetical protein NQ315_014519 [Exocentrus adspersus]
MADSVELRMSVTSIKRVDPYVKDILASATQVALYIFNISANEWEKTDTEVCYPKPKKIIIKHLQSKTDPPTFSSTPRVPDVTSQSVMDFFAKASTKSAKKPNVPGENSETVLQRLMSNPAHSVEHIEKQQRSSTPHEHSHAKQKFIDSDRRSVPVSFSGTSIGDRKNQSDNGVLDINPTTPQQHRSIQGENSPLSFLLQSQAQIQSEKEENSEDLGTSPFARFLDNSQKPHLMTPMMFTTLKQKERLDGSSYTGDKHEQVDLLTEKQLAQALIYLLKNNSEFTKQIHEAYVQSIMQRVNLNSNS